MREAPASMALSSSSLTEEERSVIAWPATRRFMELLDMGLMSGALSSMVWWLLLLAWVDAVAVALSSCDTAGGSIMVFVRRKNGKGT